MGRLAAELRGGRRQVGQRRVGVSRDGVRLNVKNSQGGGRGMDRDCTVRAERFVRK